MRQYLTVILILLVTIAWVYYTDPQYTKPILAALPAFLIILANSFYENKIILLSAVTATLFWGLSLFYYWKIDALPSPYEIYLIYLFLFMTAMVSLPLVRRTRKIFLELENEKNKIQTVIINLADGLLFFEKENKLILANPKAGDFFNVDFLKLIGLSTQQLLRFSKIKPLINLIGKEIKTISREELQVRKNLILEISALPIVREKERFGSLIILHDITREKIIERLKTEFVSTSAHQLRTPLSSIKWALRTLIEGDLGKITPEQKELLEKTYNTNERILTLVNDLLNLSKIEEGRYLYKLTPSQMEETIQEIIDSYQKISKEKKIKLVFIKPKNKTSKVNVDLEKIKLAITNLFDNSIKYTPAGGRVTASLQEKDKEICFEIKDTGLGIPSDEQKRVFTKFFRATNIKKIEPGGTGLGLFIAKNIIEAHKGRIWFDSKQGKGTTFYFTLPVK